MRTSLTNTEQFTILSLLSPYIITLFFLRYTSVFTFLGLLLFSGLFILVCTIVLFLTKPTKYKKLYYVLAAFLSVALFVFYYGQLVKTGDRIFFSIHKSAMNKVVTDIQNAKRENKQIEIPKFKYALVDTLEDGIIVFTLDGMLDNCVGIAYSGDNVNPGYTNCGRIIEWRKLDDHWYFWYTT